MRIEPGELSAIPVRNLRRRRIDAALLLSRDCIERVLGGVQVDARRHRRIGVAEQAQDDQEALLHACLDVMVGYVDGFTDEAAASAARSAARSEQYALLCRYLNGEEGPFVGGAGREP